MAVGDVGASSFEFYEGIRILVPGALAVTAYGAVVETFGIDAPTPQASALGALVAVTLIGLLLYFVDLPARTRVYKAGLPHTALESWSQDDRGGASATNLYFVLLDERMPAGIRNRALYMGSIFRIGVEAIYLLALASIGVLMLARLGVGGNLRSADGVRTVMWISAGVHLACPLLMTLFAAVKDLPATAKQLRQLVALPTALAAVGPIAVASVAFLEFPSWVGAAGLGVTTATWATLYVIGVRTARGRRNLGALPASILLAASVATAAAFIASGLPERGVLGPAGASGWSLASLAALIMVAARGHERRWFGAYYTQLAWLKLREADLKEHNTGT